MSPWLKECNITGPHIFRSLIFLPPLLSVCYISAPGFNQLPIPDPFKIVSVWRSGIIFCNCHNGGDKMTGPDSLAGLRGSDEMGRQRIILLAGEFIEKSSGGVQVEI